MKEKYIVKVDDQVVLINEVGEYVIHKWLESGWSIAKSKGHYEGFKKAKGAFEGGFPFMAFFDAYVVVAPSYVEFREITGSL